MKRTYINPDMKVVKLRKPMILCGSLRGISNSLDDDYEIDDNEDVL